MSIVSIRLWQLNDMAMSMDIVCPCRMCRYGHVESVGMAVSLTSVRLNDRMCHMNEQNHALSYTLTPNMGRPAKSVGVGRYSAQMKSTGTFGDGELQEALAAASGAKVEFIDCPRERGQGRNADLKPHQRARRDGRGDHVESRRGCLPVRGATVRRVLPARGRDALRAGRRIPGRRGGPRGRGSVIT